MLLTLCKIYGLGFPFGSECLFCLESQQLIRLAVTLIEKQRPSFPSPTVCFARLHSKQHIHTVLNLSHYMLG